MIHVYTGNGKGKTTAALGLAIRAAGSGLKVYIGQFLKGKNCSEITALKKFSNIKIEKFGTGCFIKKVPAKKDKEAAKKGLDKIEKIIVREKYDMVIMDEVNVALSLGLLDVCRLIRILKLAPKKTELILTGRNADRQIIKAADLASEIKEVKHYYNKGLKARKGIEF